ncbi:MAG TPA: CBS domain-containing protein [Kofleriaceae bacterium]|jgi:CBS domain-containing protein|nr:CBS domain-containing protein [Kofleriaceae bacterium]
MLLAGELCIRRVVTAERDENVVDAARRMLEENVGDLVVVQYVGDQVKPVGLVTDRDLVMGALARGTPDAFTLRVRDVMSDVVTAFDDEDVSAVLATLQRHKIRRLPIIDRDGSLLGILSLDDLVSWIREQLDRAAAVIEHQVGFAAGAP